MALALPTIGLSAGQVGAQTVVVGYVFPQNADLQPGQIDPSSVTRINYAFANIKNGQMVEGFAEEGKNLAFLTALKAHNPSLTVLASVGGWLWSTDFSDVALTRASRARFISSVVEYLKRYDLDGLDIDWEYPGMAGNGHPFRAEDRHNFTLLLKELRKQFDSETRKTNRKMILTIAAGASDDYVSHTELAKVQKYVNSINLMAYVYYEPGSDLLTGHHAPLFTNHSDPKKISADASVRAFEKAGVPPGKIVLGVPFYGHVWERVADVNHGLFQSGKPGPRTYAPFSDISADLAGGAFQRYWDSTASAPYLYSRDKKIFISYEDTQSLAAKCTYVLANKLGGVMFWDYAGDTSGKLLHTIDKCLSLKGASQ
ncbi:MAG: glycoside hydrolase family 18 protein [Acidobacteriaceae bacterium]